MTSPDFRDRPVVYSQGTVEHQNSTRFIALKRKCRTIRSVRKLTRLLQKSPACDSKLDSFAQQSAAHAAHNIASSSDLYWSTNHIFSSPPEPTILPPPEILISALKHLNIALSPQAQRLASCYGDSCATIEPVLALYCPIQGGDHIVDNTVRELARRSKADVVVLDTLHMAAGECGRYGAAGALLNFRSNPLYGNILSQQFHDQNPLLSRLRRLLDDDAEADFERGLTPSNYSSHSPQVFFDLLVNMCPTDDADLESGVPDLSETPRIIYIRDHPTLSSSLCEWWPALQSSVQCRRGATIKSNNVLTNKTVIVVGATSSGSEIRRGYRGTTRTLDPEETLQAALHKWSRDGDQGLLSTVPSLQLCIFKEALTSNSTGTMTMRRVLLVPVSRNPEHEAGVRIARQREVNMLTMMAAVGNLGASLPLAYHPMKEDQMWEEWAESRISWETACTVANSAVGSAQLEANDNRGEGLNSAALKPLCLSWDNIRTSWTEQRKLPDLRESWIKALDLEKAETAKGAEANSEVEAVEASAGAVPGQKDKKPQSSDELLARVKNSSDLSGYERELLGCIVEPATMETTFDDVHLPPRTIDAVRSAASLPLLNPAAFDQGILSHHSLKGVLLFGPPGTGKTHIARALAKEYGGQMMALQSAHIVSRYMGEDEQKVRAAFSLARRLSPCVLFIDEIDSLLSNRETNDNSAASRAYRAIVTEFLQEMDGLLSKKDSVIVVGATNRPWDLDDAVIRRMPLRIMVELPGEAEREAILRIHLRDEKVYDDADIKRLAKETDRFSGSDLKDLVVSAAVNSAKESTTLPWKDKPVELASADEIPASMNMPITNALPGSQASHPSPLADTLGSSCAFLSADQILSTSNEVLTTAVKHSPVPNEESSAPILPSAQPRILYWHNFEQALNEIWPSASEHLGTTARLREWNDKFSGGRKRDGGDIAGEPATNNHKSALAKVRRAFDLSEEERTILKFVIDPATITTSFEDVHLPSHTIDAVRTIVSLSLLYPDAFTHGVLKDHDMQGCLLFGPPGTGKTHLVRALAREAHAHMLAIKPSDIHESRFGASEKVVKALFALARRLKPCIIFIDELDALFSRRGENNSGTDNVQRAVLTEFMQEMDGLQSKNKNVVMIGATNRPFDLDDAVLRRLPLRLLLDLPDESEREKILHTHLRAETLAKDVNLKEIALNADKFSGSDLKHLAVGAALNAVKEAVALPWKTYSVAPTAAMAVPSGIAANFPASEFRAKPEPATSASIVRVLHARHFARARADVRPSAAENMTTNIKLREWAAKFGSNAEGPQSSNIADGWRSNQGDRWRSGYNSRSKFSDNLKTGGSKSSSVNGWRGGETSMADASAPSWATGAASAPGTSGGWRSVDELLRSTRAEIEKKRKESGQPEL